MTLPTTVRNAIALQYQDADTLEWVTLETHDLGTEARTRRFASPAGRMVTAAKWRFVKVGPDDWETAVFSVRQIAACAETEELSPHRRWAFNFDAKTQRYGLVVTDGNAEVYLGRARQASIPLPYTAEQVTRVRRAQALDTLVAFLSSVQPQRIQRQGAHTEWDTRPQAFENVPLYDYDGTNAGAVNEVQQLTFHTLNNGETFNITIGDETTGNIGYNTDMAVMGPLIQAAIEALPNFGPGKVTVTSPEDERLTVTFLTGEDVPPMTPIIVDANEGFVRAINVTQGESGGEPVISNSRGWPADGCFFEERLVMAGLSQRPGVLLASVQRQFFDLKVKGSTVGRAMDVNIASDQSTRILALWPGAQLQAFTESAEYFCPGPPLSNPPAFQKSPEALGIEPATALFDLAGGTAYIAAGGDAIAHFAYADSARNYVASTLSDHACDLVAGVVDWALRSARSVHEPAWGALIRSDGDLAFMAAMPKQEVIGFTRWTTDGVWTAAGSELKGDLYLCARRALEIGGETVERHVYEQVCADRMLDGGAAGEGPATEATGLWWLEGQTVPHYIDGADAGDVTITGGVAVFSVASERTWEVGRLFVPHGVTLAIPLQQDPRAGASLHARAGEIAFKLGPTAGLRAGMLGKRMWPLKEKTRPTELLDTGPGEDAFRGWSRVYPVPGFQRDSQVEFVQPRPGPLEIKELVITVDT